MTNRLGFGPKGPDISNFNALGGGSAVEIYAKAIEFYQRQYGRGLWTDAELDLNIFRLRVKLDSFLLPELNAAEAEMVQRKMRIDDLQTQLGGDEAGWSVHSDAEVDYEQRVIENIREARTNSGLQEGASYTQQRQKEQDLERAAREAEEQRAAEQREAESKARRDATLQQGQSDLIQQEVSPMPVITQEERPSYKPMNEQIEDSTPRLSNDILERSRTIQLK